jgi:endo-1,4-beta-xylanase
MAFKIAAAADPAAKLYYNDYNLEYAGKKTDGAVKIVKLVQSYGYKIDGVGFQGHLVVEKTPTQDVPTPSLEILTKSLKAMTDLGVDVAYTEVDIRMLTPSNTNKLNAQATAYARVAQSCMNVPRCVGITLWVGPVSAMYEVLVLTQLDRAFPTSTLGFRRPSQVRATPFCGITTMGRSQHTLLS